VIPVLALGELYRVLSGKAKMPSKEAAKIVSGWAESYVTRGLSGDVLIVAVGLAAAHKLHIWDAVTLSCCRDAGCGALLSEDM
jgi:predicted nucleic acid-binding protein